MLVIMDETVIKAVKIAALEDDGFPAGAGCGGRRSALHADDRHLS